MKAKWIVAAGASLMALTGCGGTYGESEEIESQSAAIVALDATAPVKATSDYFITNAGATDTCAFFSGDLVSTKACTTASRLSVYQVKANNRLAFCAGVVPQSFSEPCVNEYFDSSGRLLKTESNLCTVKETHGQCMTAGSGTDVRVNDQVLATNATPVYRIQYIGSSAYVVVDYYKRKFVNNIEQWTTRLDSKNTFGLEANVHLKAYDGKYLYRKSTAIVGTTATLNRSDLGFTWGYR